MRVLVTAAFIPASPMLVPRVAQGAAVELEEVRAACLEAISTALSAGPERVVLLAAGPPGEWPARAPSFARIGLPDAPTDERPLALQVGRWVLDAAGWTGPVESRTVAGASTPDHPELPGGGEAPVAVLAVGDGSARRSPAAPGHFDPAAQEYDDAVGRALAGADTGALLALDPRDDARLLVQGRPVWETTARCADAEPGGWRGDLLWSGAPLGVGYFVATWRR